jgi:hypothetical protein
LAAASAQDEVSVVEHAALPCAGRIASDFAGGNCA